MLAYGNYKIHTVCLCACVHVGVGVFVCVRMHMPTYNSLAATLIHTWIILSMAAFVLECSSSVGRTT